MADIEFEIEGIEETIRLLANASYEKRVAFESIVRKSARRVTTKAKSNAPVGPTGNLKGSIKAKYFFKDGPAATVFPRGKGGAHRHLIEYGTGARYQKKNGKFVGSVKAKPFMKPAHEAEAPIFLAEIKKVVDEDVVI